MSLGTSGALQTHRKRTHHAVVGKWGACLATATLMAGLVGCGDTGPDPAPGPSNDGAFSATVVGEGLGAIVSGKAMFGTATNSSNVTEWTLFLYSGDVLRPNFRFNVVTLLRRALSRPEAGTYSLGDFATGAPTPEDFVAAYVFSFATSYGVFLTGAGTLTVDTSTADEIVGTFALTGVRDPSLSIFVDADTVEVSGSFRAVPGSIPLTF
ncbi:MAG: hypothetical protein IH616_02810 [Gemmatimonadales bacterium]|nr:hypothetical protein [Gemmatimonadales bacterium]